MLTKAIIGVALVIFIVLNVLMLTDNFKYGWIWVFSPIVYGVALIGALCFVPNTGQPRIIVR